MKFYINLIILLLASNHIFGQDQIILNHDIEINIKYLGNNFFIKEKHNYARLINTDRNIGASESISFSSLDKLENYNARTEIPNGKGGFKTQKVKNYNIVSQDSRGVFYSGREKLMFNYPSVAKNSICKVQYEKKIVDPQFLSSFVIAEPYPIKSFSFKVTYPDIVDFEMNLLNTDSLDINFQQTKDNNIITKIITINNIPEYKYTQKLKSYLYVFPQILTRIKSVKTRKGVQNISNDVSGLYNWYSTLVKRIPESDSHIDLQNKVEELTKNLNTNEEKIKTLFKWVQNNIEYIAFEDGMNGFIPRNADHIFNKRYGDCKDMANLLKTMLTHANIPAYLTWIGTRAKPYSYKEVPSVCTDNHMICSTKINGEYVFLDATNQKIDLYTIPEAIQGKEALIGLNDRAYDIVDVPITPAKNNTRTDLVSLNLNDKTLIGKLDISLTGYAKNDYDRTVSYMSFKKETGYRLNTLNLGDNQYTTSSATEIQNPKLTTVNVDANFNNKVIKAGSKTYINLALNNFYDQLQVDDLNQRKVDIHEDYRFNHKVVTTLEIPNGNNLHKVPNNFEYNHELFNYNLSYSQEDNTLIRTLNLEIDFINLKPSQFSAYQEFLNNIKQAEKQKVILIKN